MLLSMNKLTEDKITKRPARITVVFSYNLRLYFHNSRNGYLESVERQCDRR